MKENELDFYSKLANWDFSEIKYETERFSDWDFYKKIEESTNKNSICLDLGTAAGEKVLKKYPKVGMVIGTDFSKEMIEAAKENAKKYPDAKVKFVVMDNLNMTFPKSLFNLVSARHTIIDAKQIYEVLEDGGIVVIQGVEQKDCWDLKQLFGRGQAFNDSIAISQIDYENLIKAGFKIVERTTIYENEYFKTKEDLMALLLKTPILEDFSELSSENTLEKMKIENELFEKYVEENTTERGILLKRKLYGIVAKK